MQDTVISDFNTGWIPWYQTSLRWCYQCHAAMAREEEILPDGLRRVLRWFLPSYYFLGLCTISGVQKYTPDKKSDFIDVLTRRDVCDNWSYSSSLAADLWHELRWMLMASTCKKMAEIQLTWNLIEIYDYESYTLIHCKLLQLSFAGLCMLQFPKQIYWVPKYKGKPWQTQRWFTHDFMTSPLTSSNTEKHDIAL